MTVKSDENDWGWSTLNSNQRQAVMAKFDKAFYSRENADISSQGIDLFRHFITRGWRQGRNPNKSFDIIEYMVNNGQLFGSSVNPFIQHTLQLEMPSVPNEDIDHAIVDDIFEGLDITVGSDRATLENRESKSGAIRPIVMPVSLEVAFNGLTKSDIASLREEFDSKYYRSEYPDVAIMGVDPFQHYMTAGWLEGRNPSADFCTDFYLSLYTDIADSGMNPFIHWVLHGKTELRASVSFRQKIAKKQYAPKVSVIVPNYNHGRYLTKRLDSILDQTYPDIHITVLDDCSSDNSRDVIDDYVRRYPDRISKVYNEVNSGGVFSQWRKGVEGADGELVWICESDDFCEPDFVDKLVPHFADDSVQIAFGRILETDIEGVPNLWLDNYREEAEFGIWAEPLVRPAADWFAHAFGVNNVIANVGGCLFRRSPVPASIWQEAATYRVVGDWYLYLQIASGGQIAWEPAAVSYFRRHGANTSSSSFNGTGFYGELERVMIEMRKTWNIPDSTVIRFFGKIVEQYNHFKVEEVHGPLESHCSLDKLLTVDRQRGHVLISMLGFIPGGGENFPIQLANGLVEAGWLVSMLIFSSDEVNEHMRKALNPTVSVYDAAWVTEYGCERFIREAGISLIHSHTVGAEMHFYHMWKLDPSIPYVVTLHGSYEASDITPDMMNLIAGSVDHFVYTADKNLLPLDHLGLLPDRFTKLANAMPIDPLPYPQTRAEMGIAEDAIVFTLVARGIKRKGWRAAIEAFCKLRSRYPRQPMHLCMVGEGDEPDRHRKVYGDDPDISFLGYQSRIHGLYRISDVAIVPTRFAGESYPLCIIQALQVGTPVVASDVGEISNMLLGEDGELGGVIVKAVRDTDAFIANFADAMSVVLDDARRANLADRAATLGKMYDMAPLVENYSRIYSSVIGRSDN